MEHINDILLRVFENLNNKEDEEKNNKKTLDK